MNYQSQGGVAVKDPKVVVERNNCRVGKGRVILCQNSDVEITLDDKREDYYLPGVSFQGLEAAGAQPPLSEIWLSVRNTFHLLLFTSNKADDYKVCFSQESGNPRYGIFTRGQNLEQYLTASLTWKQIPSGSRIKANRQLPEDALRVPLFNKK